jgi:hypothetical protein
VAAALDEPQDVSAAVFVISDDLAGGVDAHGEGVYRTGNSEGGVAAAAVEEAVVGAAAVGVISDDLAGGVDGLGDGVSRTGNIDGGVGAIAVEEPCGCPLMS